jgi:[ribosomal protein S5]-alanine N-acetyltransferase
LPDLSPRAVAAGRLGGRAQPCLTIDELVLRPWESTDSKSVVEAHSDPPIQRWHVWSMTEDEALTWVRSWSKRWTAETGASWAIVEDDTVLGRVGFNALDLRAGLGEAAYWVLPAARGRSVASRALCAATAWMFAEVGLHRIELLHSTRNEPSCRVAHKAGYLLEGTKREHWLFADGWHDVHLHARVRDGAISEPPAPWGRSAAGDSDGPGEA